MWKTVLNIPHIYRLQN